jgi:cell wall assembly regulator SMI1
MKATWDRIETWLRSNAPQMLDTLRPGATEGQVAEAEQSLGVTFPEPMRQSYLIHDGQSSEGEGLIDAWEFLSLERMKAEWKVWKDLLDGGEFRGLASHPESGIRPDWWNARWIPLTYSGSGDHHSLDLDPAPGGTPGQILLMYHDDPARTLVAPGFRQWLEQFADDLEAGLYVLSDEYGGLVRSDEIEDEGPE